MMISCHLIILFIFNIGFISTSEIPITFATQKITNVGGIGKISNEDTSLIINNMQDHEIDIRNKIPILIVPTPKRPSVMEQLNLWRKHHRRCRRHPKHDRKIRHHNLPSLDAKLDSAFDFSRKIRLFFDIIKNMKLNEQLSINGSNKAARTILDITHKLVDLEKLPESLLSQLPAIPHYDHYKKNNSEQVKRGNAVNDSKNTEDKETCSISGPHSCLQHRLHSTINALFNSALSTANDSSPVRNISSTSVKSSNTSELDKMRVTSITVKTTVNSSTSENNQFTDAAQKTNSSTPIGILIIDSFRFDDGGEDIPVIPEIIERHQKRIPKVNTRGSIDNNNKNSNPNNNNKNHYNIPQWREFGWRPWTLWDVEADNVDKISNTFNDHHLPWTYKDNRQVPVSSAKNFDDYLNNYKKVDMNIELPNKVLNGKNHTQRARKSISGGKHRTTYLSTLYVSLIVCGLIIIIYIWWKKMATNKRINFSTIRDSIVSSTHQSNDRLIA